MKELNAKRTEAIFRMTLLGLKQEYIDAFSREEACEITAFWFKRIPGINPELISFEEDEIIEEFEKDHSALVWAVIRDQAMEDGEEWDGYHLLYISEDQSKWEEERKALLDGKPVVYYKAISSESNTVNTGFGTIKIEVRDGILYGDN